MLQRKQLGVLSWYSGKWRIQHLKQWKRAWEMAQCWTACPVSIRADFGFMAHANICQVGGAWGSGQGLPYKLASHTVKIWMWLRPPPLRYKTGRLGMVPHISYMCMHIQMHTQRKRKKYQGEGTERGRGGRENIWKGSEMLIKQVNKIKGTGL